ncbi:MAG TPA: efflux RND transporter permease subunit [Steroidobacteraceae bacterium]|nr:efflux RND transporter permease subunit [Steroidobacteraceae bacterium]
MSFAHLLEHHRRALLCVAAVLGIAGLVAGVAIPVGLFPVTSFPRIRIEIDAGSMPARQMLIEVTQPLEERARAIPGVSDVVSTTSRGSAEIFVDFPWGWDMNQALLRVNAEFARTLPSLPPGTGYEAIQMSPNVLMPFVSYALVSDRASPVALRRLAEYQIAPLLAGIAGVRRVGVLGGETPEVEVSVSPRRLRGYGLALADVADALSKTNQLAALGRLEDDDRLYLAVGNNAFTSAQSVGEVALRTGGNGIVRLKDVATVTNGTVPQWLLVRDNGHAAVTVDVYQQDQADSLGLARTVEAALDGFMAAQPPGTRLYKWYDQTELVRSSIAAMAEAIVIGLVFAALVVLGFLRNWRAAAVALLVVPLALAVTVLVLHLLGMTFNIMTLGGLAAAIGLLIDDVIVMIEHIARRAGAPGVAAPQAQVLAAAREFLAPLLGSSLATIIIFVPLAFLTGVTGAFFRFLSVTMVAALVVSYALTALVVPLLARSLVDFTRWRDPAHGRETPLARVHGRTLRILSQRPGLIGVAVAALAAAGVLAYRHVGTGFLPDMDEGGFVLDYQTAPGTSLTESNRELGQIEALLKANPYVYTYSRRTGAGLGGDLKESYQGDFFVRLVATARPPIGLIMDQISAEITSRVPGIMIDPHQLLDDMIGDMVGRPQPVVIDLSARDPERLAGVAVKVAAAIAAVPGIVPDSVNDGVVPAGDALEVHVDPAAAAAQGETVADIQDQLGHYLYGTEVTHFLGAVQEVGVRLQLAAQDGPLYRDQLGELPLRSPTGRVFALRSVGRVDFVPGQPEIDRDNLRQIVAVTAEIGGGHDLGSTIAAVRKALAAPGVMPPGVYYSIGGAYRQQQLALEGMIRVFSAAAIAEFLLLLFLYDRFWLALVIIGSALIASGAVFVGLWLTGTLFNITAMMGMVMVVGIGTEMAIFLASEYQALEREMPPRVALQAAAMNRLRPITMSSLAMILALLPLGAAISGSGDQMLQPLAIAIMAGVVVQLPMVLLVVPVVVGLTLGRPARVSGHEAA